MEPHIQCSESAGTRSGNTLYVFDITTSGSLLGNERIVERVL